jgi:type IV secretion system protein VirB10
MSAPHESAREGRARMESAGSEDAAASEDGAPESVQGERGAATVNRVRSLQSRVSNLLAAAFMGALGLGALSWYYAHILSRNAHAVQVAKRASMVQASGDAPLPPLGSFKLPGAVAATVTAPAPAAPPPTLAAQVLGPPPPLPSPAAMAAWNQADELTRLQAARGPYRYSARGISSNPVNGKLTGPVVAASSGPEADAGASPATTEGGAAPPWTPPASPQASSAAAAGADPLAALLHPTVTPVAEASVLADLRFLLPKGAFIDCTLETAIDSTLPGMTTCVTATDTLSADGTVVLLERGTKLVGETRGQVRQGQARLFVVWTEARTPTGVIVPLDSPGTDALGRSGLAGKVKMHFWERFGAAILISVIDAGVQAGVQASSSSGTVIVNPSASQDVMTGILNSTVDIPPTISVRQGERIQVLVARDVDFSSVYRLALTEPTSFTGGSR